jgi:uncharacterized protein YndB with AHSA1/START domain
MTGRTDTATRLIDASPDAVYAAFVDAEKLIAWLPPEGMSGRVLLFEPWDGGGYRIELTYGSATPPGGAGKSTAQSDIAAGRFVELVPGRRVVQSAEFASDDPAFAGEMIVTWSFEPAGEQTKVTVTAEDVPAGISAEDHAAGLRSSLDNLARFVRPG